MRIEIEITDRELLDLDMAVTERRIKLGEQLQIISANESERIKDGDVVGARAFHSEVLKFQDELKSLLSIMDKLYEAANKNLTGKDLGSD